MVDLKEITMVNGIAVLMMGFLLNCRHKNRESVRTEDKLYDAMVIVNLLGALIEAVSFYVDGRSIAWGRSLNYLTNSLCFAGTATVGLLWCLYVDLRIYQNYKKTSHSIKLLMIPWCIEMAAIVFNLLGTGILFTISENNVYQRGAGVGIGYITLVIYFAYSIHLVRQSGRDAISLQFFPVQYFIGPCLAGIIIQFCFYGISASWISVAIALIFVQMQTYAENIYRDELSGLLNRRYLSGILAKKEEVGSGSLYGLMMDIDEFKNINDTFGHSAGDRAICVVGDLLLQAIPDGGIAFRYAGDEFIVLLSGVSEDVVYSTMKEIKNALARFNESGAEKFTLSLSIGYTEYGPDDNAESFLKHMDSSMYEEKRKYHGID